MQYLYVDTSCSALYTGARFVRTNPKHFLKGAVYNLNMFQHGNVELTKVDETSVVILQLQRRKVIDAWIKLNLLFTYTIIYFFLQFSEAKNTTCWLITVQKLYVLISPSVKPSESFSCSRKVTHHVLPLAVIPFNTFVQWSWGEVKEGLWFRKFVEITTQISLQPQYILDKIII